jgi:hypothetical protein
MNIHIHIDAVLITLERLNALDEEDEYQTKLEDYSRPDGHNHQGFVRCSICGRKGVNARSHPHQSA